MDIELQRELARTLAGLRRERRQQSGLDSRLVPPDEAAGYRVARLVADELGWGVAGWKIAALKEDLQKQLRTNAPIYGRVFAGGILDEPAVVDFDRQCGPIPEVEYEAVLACDLPPRPQPYSKEEVSAAIGSLHPGIELAECRFVLDAAFPPLPAILADGAGSGTIVLGAPIPDWRTQDIANQEVTLSCNGQVRRTGTAAGAIGHPVDSVLWLVNELSRWGIGLMAGQVVSTGTLTGMLRPRKGETYVADFGPFGRVSATYA